MKNNEMGFLLKEGQSKGNVLIIVDQNGAKFTRLKPNYLTSTNLIELENI